MQALSTTKKENPDLVAIAPNFDAFALGQNPACERTAKINHHTFTDMIS
ncbi:MAG: hypothetical protein WBB28_03885 [Crinalium sp.]